MFSGRRGYNLKIMKQMPLSSPKRSWLLLGLLSLLLLSAFFIGFSSLQSALAASPAQIPVYTPTPGPDGRIIYIVKAGETLTSISILTGVSIEDLRKLNNLTDDNIVEGERLLLGLAGPALVTPTAGPSPTPTPLLPTPTPKPGLGKLCVLLFDDLNGDSIRQEEEPSIGGGAISVRNRSSSINLTHDTEAGADPHCISDIPEGELTIGVAIPAGYNPTTETNYILELQAGDESYLDFGAQARVETLEQSQPEAVVSGEKKSPLMGIIGVVFLLAGIGLAIFARQILKEKK